VDELTHKIAELSKKHFKAYAMELVSELAIPALEAACKKTPTPIDDVLLAALKEPLKAELLALIEKV
jgi:hypothetical protein